MAKNGIKVKRLSKDISDKIAAGEVVERPASVVKELVENAIDAGAEKIGVSVKAGGVGEIRVKDDGFGMAQKDMLLVPERFATSKIDSIDDIQEISSLGFRGEALSSIAAVSRMQVASSTQPDGGFQLKLEGGEIVGQETVIMGQGTVIKVKDLFFNVPARRKFLKGPNSETRAIVDTVKGYMLSYPGVAFNLVVDGKEVFDVKSKEKLSERAKDVMNEDWVSEGVEVFYSEGGVGVKGLVAPVNLVQPARPSQLFFVNNRPVTDQRVKYVVAQAYEAFARRAKPGFVLFMTVPYSQVDVNVHPRKTEVKFQNPDKIYRCIYLATKKVITKEKESKLKTLLTRKEHKMSEEKVFTSGISTLRQKGASYSVSKAKSEDALKFSQAILSDTLDQPNQDDYTFDSCKSIQILDSYIVTEDSEGMVIIDQHAAAERVLYEYYMRSVQKGKVPVQALIDPVDIDLQGVKASKNLLTNLNALGFKAESFGETQIRIRGAPNHIPVKSIEPIINELLTLDAFSDSGLDDKILERIARLSCKHAVKFGDRLTPTDFKKLLEDLKKCENPLTCPHGRPTIHKISKEELEGYFDRR